MLDEDDRLLFLKRLRKPGIDGLAKRSILKKIAELCKKVSRCFRCGLYNGPIKKAGFLKVFHERYRPKGGDPNTVEFYRSFDPVIPQLPEIQSLLKNAQEDLTPQTVLDLFKNMTDEDCELLGLNATFGRPENFIMRSIPVPPAAIRPSVPVDSGAGTNEDDLTAKLSEIVHTNNYIQQYKKGTPMQNLMVAVDYLQLQCALYINSDAPGALASAQPVKPIRGLCQRLKGKQGRFRGNLSGKRVDFSARTVISPDPNLRIDEVAVPEDVAKMLTYPEKVFDHNIERLRQVVMNGPEVHPGANLVQFSSGLKKSLKYANRKQVARELKPGDIVQRHLHDGDVVLFNRQPSLHKLSIMAHFAKVKPWRTFRFNECACSPYNADFDGDEMNIHLPQTEEARAEALVLMGLSQNLVTPRNGELMIAAIQDFVTTSYLLSRKDQFYDRHQFAQICQYMGDALLKIDMPPPIIQIFGVLLKPNRNSTVLLNLETKGRGYSIKDRSTDKELCPNDGYVIIRNSEVICGTFDKSIVGGAKSSIFYSLLRDYGSNEAVTCMTRLAKLCARWIGNHGFSIGIDDVQPSTRLTEQKEALVQKGYASCDNYIEQFKLGKLQSQPGCTAEESLEAVINNVLSQIREEAGKICLKELGPRNSPLIMALSGAKGSSINVSQMVACVGQQTVNGHRVPEGFLDRTLPHFTVNGLFLVLLFGFRSLILVLSS